LAFDAAILFTETVQPAAVHKAVKALPADQSAARWVLVASHPAFTRFPTKHAWIVASKCSGEKGLVK
jgi:hypothetical protein